MKCCARLMCPVSLLAFSKILHARLEMVDFHAFSRQTQVV